MAVSAIKRNENADRDTLVIRLWNLGGEAARERLRMGRPLAAAWQVNLLEERGEAIPIGDPHHVEIELGPHAILSIELEFAPRP